MAADDRTNSPLGGRPRSKSFLRLSLDNPYAELGVSPLATTEEIANRISELRAKAMRRSRATASRSTDDENEKEVLRLDKINDEIGDAKKRSRYDELFPQNILLTVQQSPAEQAWLRHRKAGLITEWLYDVLGEDAFLPTPRCVRLWAPSEVEPQVMDLLAPFAAEEPTAPSASTRRPAEGAVSTPSVDDLERIIKEE